MNWRFIKSRFGESNVVKSEIMSKRMLLTGVSRVLAGCAFHVLVSIRLLRLYRLYNYRETPRAASAEPFSLDDLC